MDRTGHHESRDEGEEGGVPRAPEEEGAARKRIDLSVSQVAGAGAATLTAATAASYLNVYGTVIGAAVIAVLSTVASPLLQHWFSRSGEQAKQLAEKAVCATAFSTTAKDAPADGRSGPDATRTTALPRVAAEDGGPHTGDLGATRAMAAPPVAEDGRDAAGDRPARLGWRAVIVPAVVVFTLVMLVILAFELLTGRSMTAWMHGYDEPTAPSILGGGTSAPPAQEETEPPETTVDVPEGTGQSTEGTTGDPEDTGTTEGTDGTGETGTDGETGDGQPPVTPTPDPGDTGDGGSDEGGETTEPTPPAEGDGGGSEGSDPGGEAPADDSLGADTRNGT